MREIKFRAWNKTVKQFTYFGDDEPSIEYNADDRWGMYLKATNSVYLSAYEEPQQYTGLKDKNGKEIYEGDIAKVTVNDITFNAQITFEIGSFMIAIEEPIMADYFEDNWNDNVKALNELYWEQDVQEGELYYLEVIDNIYENPEEG